jgi:DNA-binding LacI/PurR family transcriptional regulator
MVRLKDIAQAAGLSLMTISKALRDEHDISPATKAKVKALAKQMGYVPDSSAQSLRTRNTRLLGIVISSLANPIFSRLVLAIQERAYEFGYDILLAYTMNDPEREDTAIRRLMARRVEGIFISPVYRIADEVPVYKDLLARRTPAILLGHAAPFCHQFLNVECDDVMASYEVTRHLQSLGHSRIAFLGGPPGTPWTAERFEGYRRALRERGVEVDDRLVFQSGRSVEDGQKTAEQILSERPDITAIQAVNDLIAVGCASTLMANGFSVPGDISVAGFGNTLISEHFRVPLTTSSQPKYRLGAAAMEMMMQLLKGRRPEPRRLPADLVVRSSTGTAPASPVLKRQ